MKKFTKILMSALCVAAIGGSMAALGGCGDKKESVTVSGSTSVEAIMTPLAGEYEKVNNVRININANGSGAGITDTIEGRNEIGMSSRALKPEEEEKGIEGKQLCLDGIVLVVSKSCAIDEVSNEEIFNLFVNGTAIERTSATLSVAVGRESGSGTRDGFDEQIKDAEGNAIAKNYQYKNAQQLGGTGLVINAITNDADNRTVGYVSMGSYLKNTDKLKALKFKAAGQDNYIEPSEDTILNGTYKLQRPFVIVTKKDKSGMSEAAKAFYEWMFGAEAEKMIKDNGYVIKK